MIYLITAAILIGVAFDKLRDVTNANHYKTGKHKLPWPLRDTHHVFKNISFLTLSGALWGLLWHFGAPWWHCTAVAGACWLLWRVIPEPYWWRR